MTTPPAVVEPDDPDYAAAERTAQGALAQAARHRTPPSPAIFEVWYAYVCGDNPALNAMIDTAAAQRGGRVGVSALERARWAHIEQAPQIEGVAAIGDKLDAGLSTLVTLIRSGVVEGHAFNDSLQRLGDRISEAIDSHSLRSLVEQLAEANHAQIRKVEAFSQSIDAMKAEMAEMKRELSELRDTAYVDHLTGVANRRRFEAVLEEEILLSRRSGAPLSVALADLDEFKRINDNYGHSAGDSVLKRFARIITENIKGKDTAGRIGGEEFAILMPNTGLRGGFLVAEAIRQALWSKSFVLTESRQRMGRMSASFGVTELRAEDDIDSLLGRADALLYEAKNTGRNRVHSA